MLAGSKTKHTKLIPQADERYFVPQCFKCCLVFLSVCAPCSAFVSDYRSSTNRARRVSEFLAEYRDGRERTQCFLKFLPEEI